jgi:hypothetical protein
MTVGIPSGRRLVLLPRLGMYTRLTGRALNGSALCSILSTNLALASGVSTTSPSTPAVRRPALRSVTRRTLNSVLARDLIINFCRLRTLARSPAFDAVKIRCRSRRTSSSTRRQSTWRQSKGASSGPFTTTVAIASNLSSGSGASIIFLLTGSPDRVSALSRPGTRPGIRPVVRNDRREEAANVSRFPAAFRLPAFASRSSCSRRGVGPSLRSAYRARPLGPDLDGVTTFRTREQQPGWVPSLPRGRRCSSRPSRFLDRRLPLYRGQSLHPAPASHRAGLRLTRHQREFKQFTRPAFPSPVAARMERAALGLFPELRTPPTRSRTTHARAGTGHRARTWNYTLNSHLSISNPVVLS